MLKQYFYLFTIAILSAAISLPAQATENKAFQAAFEKSYDNPTDIDAAIAYAEEAVKIGDYESAIPPLERILMFNPKLADVRLEVGVLYYLLNADVMAKKHFDLVASDPEASNSVKTRAKTYLSKLSN